MLGPWFTMDRPLKSNRYLIWAIRARSNGAGVRAGRWLAGEEGDADGAMAGGETSLRMRRSSALLDDLGALEDRGAHRESSGGERSVQGGSEAQVDSGGNGWRERRMRVRWNPGESRPKSEIDGTYGRGETRRSSGSRRRRGSRRGRGSSPAAVATGTANKEREEGGKGVRLGFIGRGCCVDGRGAGHGDGLPCRRASAVACRLGVRHRRAEEGKGRGEEGKGDGSAVEWDQRGSERKGRERRACEQRPKRSGAG